MSTTTLVQRQRQKTDYAVNWTQINPVLLLGEIGWERDTKFFKFGDGVSTWTSLGYAGTGGGASVGVNIEGGWPDSNYGATIGIDGGIPSNTYVGAGLDGGTP